jgi:hypothetical protein
MGWNMYGNTFEEVNEKHSCKECAYFDSCGSANENSICGDFWIDEENILCKRNIL